MKIIIIGNSHASSLAGNWDHEEKLEGFVEIYPNIFSFWNIPFGCWWLTEDILEEKMSRIQHMFDKDTIILGYLGSQDIRDNFAKYKNGEETALSYATIFLKYFNKYGSKVGFITPVPVADDLFFFERDPNYDKWGNGDRQDILEQYNMFTNELKKHSTLIIDIVDKVIGRPFLSKNESIDGCHLNPKCVITLIKEVKMLLNNNDIDLNI